MRVPESHSTPTKNLQVRRLNDKEAAVHPHLRYMHHDARLTAGGAETTATANPPTNTKPRRSDGTN